MAKIDARDFADYVKTETLNMQEILNSKTENKAKNLSLSDCVRKLSSLEVVKSEDEYDEEVDIRKLLEEDPEECVHKFGFLCNDPSNKLGSNSNNIVPPYSIAKFSDGLIIDNSQGASAKARTEVWDTEKDIIHSSGIFGMRYILVFCKQSRVINGEIALYVPEQVVRVAAFYNIQAGSLKLIGPGSIAAGNYRMMIFNNCNINLCTFMSTATTAIKCTGPLAYKYLLKNSQLNYVNTNVLHKSMLLNNILMYDMQSIPEGTYYDTIVTDTYPDSNVGYFENLIFNFSPPETYSNTSPPTIINTPHRKKIVINFLTPFKSFVLTSEARTTEYVLNFVSKPTDRFVISRRSGSEATGSASSIEIICEGGIDFDLDLRSSTTTNNTNYNYKTISLQSIKRILKQLKDFSQDTENVHTCLIGPYVAAIIPNEVAEAQLKGWTIG